MRFPPVTTIPFVAARATGNHLAAQNDEAEFSEVELLAADRQRNENKPERWHEQNDFDALAIQVQRMRDEGAL